MVGKHGSQAPYLFESPSPSPPFLNPLPYLPLSFQFLYIFHAATFGDFMSEG